MKNNMKHLYFIKYPPKIIINKTAIQLGERERINDDISSLLRRKKITEMKE